MVARYKKIKKTKNSKTFFGRKNVDFNITLKYTENVEKRFT